MSEKNKYSAEDIKVLEGLEGVRRRPSMYVGSTGKDGLHHLVYEVVDNSIDEAMAGFCDTVIINLNKDGSVTVIAKVKRDGNIYQQEYSIGKPLYSVKNVGKCGRETGTEITFFPDTDIFSTTVFVLFICSINSYKPPL